MARTSTSIYVLSATALICLGLQAGPASAQKYPSQPIKIVVATPPGGIADLAGRTFAQKLSERGMPAFVENRTGAGGALAAEAVAKAMPDGHTLLVSMHQMNAILPHLTSKLAFDPQKDFAPILHATASYNILVVNPSVPAKTMNELVAYAKANPGKLTYASQGNGSSGHVVGEQFKRLAGIEVNHVPYRGAAPASQDLIAGHVSMMFDIVPLARVQIAAGKVRGLAVASEKRLPAVPDVPTTAEAGFPQIEGGPWFGIVAPAGTPDDAIAKLNAAFVTALKDPAIVERIRALGSDPLPMTPDEFSRFIGSEAKKWETVVAKAAKK